MRRLLVFLTILLVASPTYAQEEGSEKEDGSGLEVVPLVDMKAPLVVIWFVAGPDIPLDDMSAVEAQVYEDFQKRMDIRVLSREKTLKLMAGAENTKLQECKAEDVCLLQIGKVVKAAHVVGVIMEGTVKNYRLLLRSFALNRKPPAHLNSVVEGSLTELLIGGAAGAIAALFENTEQYAPVDSAILAAIEKPKETVEKKQSAPAQEVKVKATAELSPVAAGAPPGEKTGEKVETTPEIVSRPPERPGFFKRHLWSAIALGVGVVAGGVGIGFGLQAKSAEDDLSWSQDDPGTWDPDRDSEGRSAATIANVMFGVAGAAAITSLVLFFFFENDSDEPGVAVVPAGAGVQALIRW